jgi:hypothetical protein
MKLDITDAFHHVPVKEEHTKYQGIITTFGQYTYQVASIGFCNSHTYWQRYIETALQDVIGPNVAVCMNEIVKHTRGSIEDHEELVEKVLKIIENHNIKCNIKKCKLRAKNLKLLGHGINVFDDGVTAQITNEYKKAIKNPFALRKNEPVGEIKESRRRGETRNKGRDSYEKNVTGLFDLAWSEVWHSVWNDDKKHRLI